MYKKNQKNPTCTLLVVLGGGQSETTIVLTVLVTWVRNLCMLDSQILRKGKGFESIQSTYKQVNVWYYLGKLHSEGMRQSE